MSAGATRAPGVGRAASALDAVGEGTALLARSVWEARRVRSIGGETLRQAALAVTGSVLALAGLSVLTGAGCATESLTLGRQLGARGAAGGIGAFCAIREMIPLVVGYVAALAIGCRLVGDLAEARGDAAVRAGPRVLGVLLVVPLAYLLALALTSAAMLAVGIVAYDDASGGTFIGLYFAFHDDTDLALAFAKCLVLTLFVLATALRCGAEAGRGATDGATAAARFALVAVVGVTVIGAVLTVVVYGANPRIGAG